MRRDLKGIITFIVVTTISLIGLGIVDFNFFQTFVELSCIFLALVIFIIAAYSSGYSKGSNLLFIGVAYLSIAIIDLMHTFNAHGFSVFNFGVDYSIHLWLAARSIEAFILYYAFSKLIKRNNLLYMNLIGIFGSVTLLVLVLSNSGLLPNTYYPDTGYTLYKIIINIIIILILLFAIYVIKKNEFRVFNYTTLIVAIAFKIISEMAFIFDSGNIEYLEIIKHISRYISYVLLFMVFARDLLLRPYESIFRAFKNKEEELLELSKKDSLTGLYNHSTSYEIMREIIKKNKDRKSDVCLMMVDIDDFKCINDKYGHVKGDEILLGISKIFMNCDGPLELAGRYGGDEFVVLFVNCDRKMAKIIAKKIFVKMEQLSSELDITVTLSIGIAEWNIGLTAKDLVKSADYQMYEAKSIGKNTFSIKAKSE